MRMHIKPTKCARAQQVQKNPRVHQAQEMFMFTSSAQGAREHCKRTKVRVHTTARKERVNILQTTCARAHQVHGLGTCTSSAPGVRLHTSSA